MKNTIRAGIRAALLAGMLAATEVAAWGGTVYDPWNHAENISQLAKQVEQVQQTIQLVSQGGQMLDLANLNQMSWVIDLVKVHQQMGTLGALQSALGQFYQSASGASGAVEGIWKQYQNSDVRTWEDYAAREQRIADASHGQHTAAFQHASATLAGLDQQHQTIRDLSAKTDTSVGSMQLLQVLNKHMGMIAQQNTQLLAVSAQGRQEESDEKAQEDLRTKEAVRLQGQWRKSNQRSVDSLRSWLGGGK